MRVGMILDKAFPPDPRVENEALALIGAQHEVFLFCLNFEERLPNESYQGIALRRYPCSTLLYKLSALAYTFPWYSNIMAKKIAHFISENRIEVLHIHDMRIAAAALKANASVGLPTVLDLHENLPEIMKEYRHVQQFPGKFLIFPERWKQKEAALIERVSHVVVVTEESKSDIEGRVAVDSDKVIAVPNTVRPSFYENTALDASIKNNFEKSFVLLYIGDTAIRRGLPTAIEAISLLRAEIPEIQLVIVGKSTADQELKRQVALLNLEAAVTFEGWQNPGLFPSYILASDVCISPLHRNRHHDTTFANKLFQYMSFSKPVLVSDVTAQKNLIESAKAGLVHKAKDAHDFAEKVRQLYRDPQMAQKMGRQGKELVVTEFNWKVSSKNLVDLYDNLKG